MPPLIISSLSKVLVHKSSSLQLVVTNQAADSGEEQAEESCCFSSSTTAALTSLVSAEQRVMLKEAWQRLNCCECYHGVVAIDVDRDVGNQFLEIRETAADVRLVTQLTAFGQSSGISATFHAAFGSRNDACILGVKNVSLFPSAIDRGVLWALRFGRLPIS